ncbi:hypothetical protein [Streptomyces xanthochromogenes]|uniref:Scaffolding protein n=1 Tax=Streptomyces xanthochromogenes TaxID=67384 RepID=A0ABQ3AV73_9ACTN|nr:hypothetical protein [Streptomyces xanthochromogenes]GGY65581.1 hypothetical protein GCM10010326_70230 [Streptomyces xanthochromogenes]
MLTRELPVHPYNGIRAVGFRANGRPIWPIKGGSGESDEPAAPMAEDPDSAPGAQSSQSPDSAAERQLADATARAEQASTERDELRAALDAVTKALNPDGSEAEQDPAKLAAAVADRDKQLDQVAAELRTARVELAAHKAAADQGARADRLLNSRSFLTEVAGLDPTADAFDDQLATAIKTAVEADPDLYRAAPVAPLRGGAEISGAPAGERRPATLHDAIAARLSS